MHRLTIRALLISAILALAVNAWAQPPTGQPTPAQVDPADTLPWKSLADGMAAPVGSYIYIRAKLDALQPPRPNSRAPWNLNVSDRSGPGKVVIFQETWNEIPQAAEQFRAGVVLELFVEVQDYRGQKQLVVNKPAYMRVQAGSKAMGARFGAAAPATDTYIPVTIQTLNRQTVGRKVRVKGTITKVTTTPSDRVPTRIMLQDESGTVLIIFWKEVGEKFDAGVKLEEGRTLEIGGIVTEFENTIQVRIDDPGQVRGL